MSDLTKPESSSRPTAPIAVSVTTTQANGAKEVCDDHLSSFSGPESEVNLNLPIRKRAPLSDASSIDFSIVKPVPYTG